MPRYLQKGESGLENVVIQEYFYPFDLGNVDAVLGVKWLASLDKVRANWELIFCTFA